MVLGANFNKFGVVNDLNDPMTQKVTVMHGIILGQTSTGLAFTAGLNEPRWFWHGLGETKPFPGMPSTAHVSSRRDPDILRLTLQIH